MEFEPDYKPIRDYNKFGELVSESMKETSDLKDLSKRYKALNDLEKQGYEVDIDREKLDAERRGLTLNRPAEQRFNMLKEALSGEDDITSKEQARLFRGKMRSPLFFTWNRMNASPYLQAISSAMQAYEYARPQEADKPSALEQYYATEGVERGLPKPRIERKAQPKLGLQEGLNY